MLSSYLNRNQLVGPFCTVADTTGQTYGNYNYVVIIIIPTFALFLNCIGYIRANSVASSEIMRQELKKVFATLVIAALAVILSAVPNVILWGNGIYWGIPVTTISLFYIGFCCNSATDLFAFTILKRDFRHRLFEMLSIGYLNSTFKLPEVVEIRIDQRAVNARTISVRSAPLTSTSEIVDITANAGRNGNRAGVGFQDEGRRA
jgi:hypothetical protein